jgi:N-acetylglucosamine-6-phosphate deacetylase
MSAGTSRNRARPALLAGDPRREPMSVCPVSTLVGRHYRSGEVVRVAVSSGRISAIEPAAGPMESLPWIAPGFLDIQTNGYGGKEFSSDELTPERVAIIAAEQPRFGVTQFCPTVTTAGYDTLVHSLRTIVAACRESREIASAVVGIHLEGPYLSREDGPRGAHPLEHCRPCDWDEFSRLQAAAAGQIRLLTLSPEYPQSATFIRKVVDSGVVVAIGHTSADSSQIRAAVDAGASLSTHLGNGTHRSLRRHPNYIWDQLAEDRLMASLIVDGHHLPPEVVQTFVRAKSPERCILVSDLSGMAGLPKGRYATQLCELEILADGRLVIAGQEQLLAGASRGLEVGVGNVMRFAGVSLASAVDMVRRHPAALLRLPQVDLKVGSPADLVAFELKTADETDGSILRVRSTYRAGVLVFESATAA